MKKLSVLIILILSVTFFTKQAHANGDLEKTLSLELLIPAISFEIGKTSKNNNHYALKLQAGLDDVYGGEITITKPIDQTGRHWYGAGIGHLEEGDDEDNLIITFDTDTFISLNYKYYYHGLGNQGFHFGTALKFDVSEGGDFFPFINLGYNF